MAGKKPLRQMVNLDNLVLSKITATCRHRVRVNHAVLGSMEFWVVGLEVAKSYALQLSSDFQTGAEVNVDAVNVATFNRGKRVDIVPEEN